MFYFNNVKFKMTCFVGLVLELFSYVLKKINADRLPQNVLRLNFLTIIAP